MKGAQDRLLALHAAAVFTFLYAPIAVLVLFSFSESRFAGVWGGFSLRWYARLFENEQIRHALLNTLIVGCASTVIAGVLGTAAAIGIQRLPPARRPGFEAFFYLPIVTPDIVLGISLLATFALVLGMDLSLVTMTIAHVVFNIGYVAVVVTARLKGFDHAIEEAAFDLGASPWQVFWRIKLPLLWPGVLGGGLLALAMSIDEFVISFFTSGPGDSTLPLHIYSMLRRGVTPEINALATLMLAASILLATLSVLLQSHRR